MSSATILSIVMLAALALVLGAFALWRRGGSRLQVGLMLVLAVVMVVNVVIWVPLGEKAPLIEVQGQDAGAAR